MAGFGTYHFLPWLRRGIGAAIPKATGSLPARASFQVQLTVGAALKGAVTSALPAPASVNVYGPGDIVGIDPNLVIRTEPRNFTTNFEPNYLAAIDFDSPDFPWLFTPDAATGDRLAPWIALIVLKDAEFTVPAGATSPLPSIGITSIAALQDLSENWSFAHVQVSSDAPIAELLATDPGHAISRVLCPRRLDPETSYTAFLVPAFEIGREAGLGIDVSAVTSAVAAWSATTAASAASPYPMPYYYRFEFHTSDEGDFESLVRRIVPIELPPGVGQRPIAVDSPGQNIPSAGPPLDFDGALIGIGTQPQAWNDPPKTAFQSEFQTFVNLTSPAIDDPTKPDPTIVPPIYGRWHAGKASVDRTHAGWLDDLNLDPRRRTPSGFGTTVVQSKRTALLASAWQQIAGVVAANRLLRQAQLARATMVATQTKHFTPAIATSLLSFTSPVNARLRAGAKTMLYQIRTSPIPERMLSGAFRRIARPLGPIRRRQAAPPASSTTLLSSVNTGTLVVVPASKPPAGMIAVDQVSAGVAPAPGAPVAHIVAGAALRASSLDPTALKSVPANPGFTVAQPGGPVQTTSTTGTADSPDAVAFRSAMTDLATFMATPQPTDPVFPALDIDAHRTAVLASIDPTVTVPARALAMIATSGLSWKPADPIAPIMAAPEFPQPMYAPLRDLSQQYILPGVDQVPPDSLGLLQTNHAFVESYLVGLNHEMARQLLVDGYPTDQRGSYFRQFWDTSAYVPQPGDPAGAALAEQLKDIPPINTWPLDTRLGNNTGASAHAASVVLVIRGELLKRYPNTIVFAGKAVADAATGELHLDESATAEQTYLHPIFGATLAPDITFFGFDLTVDAALGTNPVSAGYFFGFVQAPTEPRFGLEPIEDPAGVSYWSELSWLNFASSTTVTAAPAFVGGYTGSRLASTMLRFALGQGTVPAFVPATAQPSNYKIGPGTDAANTGDAAIQWGNDSAQAAYILFRRPYRIMVHASRMLPHA